MTTAPHAVLTDVTRVHGSGETAVTALAVFALLILVITLTSTALTLAILDIPWLSLLVVGVLVPLVAGAIAWAGIRKAPQVTRRAT